jgi:hypothetical protein
VEVLHRLGGQGGGDRREAHDSGAVRESFFDLVVQSLPVPGVPRADVPV